MYRVRELRDDVVPGVDLVELLVLLEGDVKQLHLLHGVLEDDGRDPAELWFRSDCRRRDGERDVSKNTHRSTRAAGVENKGSRHEGIAVPERDTAMRHSNTNDANKLRVAPA